MIAYTQGDILGREANIAVLRLDLKGAEHFPEWVFGLSNLQELHLFNAQFGLLHFAAWPWAKLERLKLMDCGLKKLDASIDDTADLRVLDLSGNPGLEWPARFLMNCPQLQSLSFSRNALSEVVLGGLRDLRQLRVLMLEANDLSRIPADVFYLTQLRVLDISKNRIARIPKGFSRLRDLDQFSAAHNRIKNLPEDISALGKLTQLQLNNNRIYALPEGVKHCTMLRKINLNKNKFDTFPAVLCELPWLSELELAQNKIGQLPNGLGTFQQLSKLDLSRNLLTSISTGPDQWPRLRELRLDRNKLTDLPRLPSSLISIAASANRLARIPATLLQLPDLKELTLERNNIEHLPADFGNLPDSLIRFGLGGNPIREDAEDLLPLRQLKEITGLMSPVRRRDLAIAQHTARVLDLPKRLDGAFFRLLRSDLSVLSDLAPQDVLLALNHPVNKVAARVRRYIQKDYGLSPKGRSLKKGSILGIAGRTFFDRSSLEERLEGLGIQLLPDYDPDRCTHLLLGFPPLSQQIPRARQVILTERQLALRLDKLEKKKLLKERSQARLSRLKQLLTSHDTTNIRLGFRMIAGNGLPPSLWNELLAAYYLSERDPGLQLQIKSYIRLRLKDEGKNKFFAALTPQLIKWGKIKPEKEELLQRNRFDLGLVQQYLR